MNLKKNIILTITIFISLVILPFYFQKSIPLVKAQTYTDVSVQQAYEMITNSTLYPDLIILDVRSQSEFDAYHLCNATLIPSTELDSRINELMPYNETEIIVYCLSGGRSVTASQTLANNGFIKIFNMVGGISAWTSAGYPICPVDSNPFAINFSFFTFVLLFFFSTMILIALYKKKISKKHKKTVF